MANETGSSSNGERLKPKTITADQAEKGGFEPPMKKGSMLGGIFRKDSPLKPGPRSSGNPVVASTTGSDPGRRTEFTLDPPKSSPTAVLLLAVTEGDYEKVDASMNKLKTAHMLESAGFAAQDPSGNGLLQIAALYGHEVVLKTLLDQGININAVDRNHGTALQAAIYMGQEKIWRLLLDWKKAKKEKVKITAGRGKSKPNSREKEKIALNDKLQVNTKGGYYGCALQVAAYKANEPLVRELLNRGADVNIFGGKFGTSLQAAARSGRKAVVELVLSKDNVNAKGGKYGTALQAVARGQYRNRILLPELSRGQPLTQEAKISPCQPVNRAATEASEEDYVNVANLLFKRKAKMNGGSGRLNNPINAAACSGSKAMLKLMLENFKERSPEWKVEDGSEWVVVTKALLTAITQSPEKQLGLVELLLDHGARIQYEITDTLPNLPLEAAATKNLHDVVVCLLRRTDEDGRFADILAESGIHGTALRAAIAACKPGEEDVAECLIEKIAEQRGLRERSPIDRRDVTPGTPTGTEVGPRRISEPITRKTEGTELNWTKWDTEYGNVLQLATVRGLKSTVSQLLHYRADPNVRDTSQRTALHLASWFGFPEIVEHLLAKGAEVGSKDKWGSTPLNQAEESLNKKGHLGATEEDLQLIIQTLRTNMGGIESDKPGLEFLGPTKIVPIVEKGAKPVFDMPIWNPGVGFRATIVDIWESVPPEQECLLLKTPWIEEILYHRAGFGPLMTNQDKQGKGKNKLRWIHLPTNNMTWAEMLISSLCKEKELPAYKSLWGPDPFYTSSDLSPHARFIAPQCGRLVPDGNIPGNKIDSSPLFMAMPYIHWETHRARKEVSDMVVEVGKESRNSDDPDKDDQPPLWPSAKEISDNRAEGQLDNRKLKTAAKLGRIILDTAEGEEKYQELLRRYLYKRLPVHLRRTLDQYYYTNLADTNDRDTDQVVMRQFNEDQKILQLQLSAKYNGLLKKREQLEEDEKSSNPGTDLTAQQTLGMKDQAQPQSDHSVWQNVKRKLTARSRRKKLKDVEGKLHKIDQVIYYDDNSPILMIDQLWLWIIDEETIVTCFPHRQYGRNALDLDAADKTDILKAIVSYLHNARRPEINSSYALAELIISQCVGILHKADMNPNLDFLKKYSVQSNKWADQVMKMLSKFVRDFQEFMAWIKEQPAESEESIRWFESIFSVTEQTQLLRNIQDIKDELGMLKAVLDDQIQVLTAVVGLIEQVGFHCAHGSHGEWTDEQENVRCSCKSIAVVDQSSKHLKHIEHMQVQANQAYDTLKDLLNLKQQQANVLEARVSRNEAISSGEQSKTIMVFTVVTIIFLPLTFATTIFTLPIAEFQRVIKPHGETYPTTLFIPWRYIFNYVGGITVAIAVPLILAAWEIQSVQNAFKKEKLKWSERRRLKKLKETKEEDDGMPDFLKG